MSDAPSIVRKTLGSSGWPLDSSARTDMESRFGRNFGDVRVHTDHSAAESAGAIDALAYTMGKHIVFGQGQYTPQSNEGRRLLAHELAHVAQQDTVGGTVRRQSDPNAPAAQMPAAVAPTPPASDSQPHAFPTTGETVTFAWIELTESPEQLTEVMRRLIATGFPKLAVPIAPGISAPDEFFNRLLLSAPVTAPCTPGDADYDRCHRIDLIRTKIIPPLSRVVEALRGESLADLARFEDQARKNALDTLTANETETKAEAIKYGITSQQIEKIRYRVTGEGPLEKETTYQTKYSMDPTSPSGKNLRDAAAQLLKRRQDITAKQDEQRRHLKYQRDPYDPKGQILVPDEQYALIGKEIEKLQATYKDARNYLSAQYPALAAFSDLDKGTDELERLAKGPGSDMAALIGAKIAETLNNIDKVRGGLKPQ
ncbi:MAG: DUF4157 domain-containing protein, partial [Methylocella sp.]